MLCPVCNKQELDLKDSLEEMEEYIADGAMLPMFINVYCETCSDMPVSIWIEVNDVEMVVETTAEALEGKDVVMRYPKHKMGEEPGDEQAR